MELTYKNYRLQQPGRPAPEALLRLDPLVAMQKLLQHVLPPHFHRTRSYGLHAASTRKRLGGQLAAYVRQTPSTVLVLLRVLKLMLRQQVRDACEACGSLAAPRIDEVAPDRQAIAVLLVSAARPPPFDPVGFIKTPGKKFVA